MTFEQADALDMSSGPAKQAAYELLGGQVRSLLQGEHDWLANLSQFAALIYGSVPDLNWAGFYIARGQELVLGPFQGKVACVRIPFDRGVCGACARTREIQIVADVNSFDGHIACDSASRSELVVPLMVGSELRAVFDLDSPSPARFDAIDAEGVAAAVAALMQGTDWD
jgi:GAF domain-containing protein